MIAGDSCIVCDIVDLIELFHEQSFVPEVGTESRIGLLSTAKACMTLWLPRNGFILFFVQKTSYDAVAVSNQASTSSQYCRSQGLYLTELKCLR